MEFEDVLKTTGDFGRYQKILVCAFLVPALTVAPWFAMDIIFLASSPDHWCRVPDVEKSNLSHSDKMALIRPADDPSCSTYDVNFTTVIDSGNWTPGYDWSTISCPDGWSYDTTDYEATAVTRWNMVCSDSRYATVAVSLLFVGDIIGTLVFGYLPEKIGRKASVVFLAVFTGLTEISSVLSPNFTAFLILRVLNGATMTPLYVVSYISMLELVGTGHRASMNAIAVGSWSLGLCLLPVIAWATRNWIKLSFACSSAALSFLVYWKLLPESPRWLITQGRFEDARDIMMRISKVNGRTVKPDELLQQLQTIGSHMRKKKEGEEKHSPLDFIRYPRLRKKFLLVTVCFIGNSLAYFGLQVNVKNLFGNQFINFFLLSVVEFPAHAATWYFMEKFGRRWSSVGALTVTALACLIPVFLPSEMENIGVLASLLAKLGASSAYMTLYQQSPELYPTPLRGVGMSMSATIGMSTTLTAPYIADLAKYGRHIPFLLFAMTSVCAAMCASFLPETLNKKLPQTIEDAERFGNDEKYFSCVRGRKPSDTGHRSPRFPTDPEQETPAQEIRETSDSLPVHDLPDISSPTNRTNPRRSGGSEQQAPARESRQTTASLPVHDLPDISFPGTRASGPAITSCAV